MNTSSALCKFSPLRTPDIRKTKIKSIAKLAVIDPSDTESVTTKELRTLANSITDKMAKKSSLESSDDDLFITQKTFQTVSGDKGKSKGKRKSSRDSDLSLSDTDSEKNLVPVIEKKKKKTKDRKKKDSVLSRAKAADLLELSTVEDSEAESAIIANMSQPDIKLSDITRNKHDISDSDEDSSDNNDAAAATSKHTKQAVKRKNTDSAQAPTKVSPKKKKKVKETVSDIDSSSSDSDDSSDSGNKPQAKAVPNKSNKRDSSSSSVLSISDSEDDNSKTKKNMKSGKTVDSKKESNSSKSPKKGASSSTSPKKPVNGHPSPKKASGSGVSPKKRHRSGILNRSDDEDEDEPIDTSRDNAASAINEKGDGSAENKLRYAIPEKFTMETAEMLVDGAELEDKDVFLITAPSDFEMSVLNGQKLRMKGEQIICAGDESEKQYEVTCVQQTQEKRSGMCTLLADPEDGNQSITVGPEVCGQIMVMQWVPALPPVEITRTKPGKHRVPDHLKPTFKPFGSSSPEREFAEPTVHKKHKKAKKKKKKENLDVTDSSMQEDTSAIHSHMEIDMDSTVNDDKTESDPVVGSSEKKKKKKKKHKKHKGTD